MTPVERWTAEFAPAKKLVEKWHRKTDKIIDRYIDERDHGAEVGQLSKRINLFHSNITTLQAMLYGNTPKVEVKRRFDDFEDDVARVAGVILQRILNTDVEESQDAYTGVLQACLEDRLLGGLGVARLRYTFEEEIVEFDGVEYPMVTDEAAEPVYVYWKDVLWSPVRRFEDLRWVAFRVYMTKEEAEERFGEDKCKELSFNSKGPLATDEANSKEIPPDKLAEIWEIWCKDDYKVYWFSESCPYLLDEQEDPLELRDFFPMPKWMLANVTNRKLLPQPDFVIAQDLYNAIDVYETRIQLLTSAVKAVGVYDKKSEGIKRMLNEAVENQLIPVDNWARFAESGGIRGQVDWMPLDDIVNTINVLTQKQAEKVNQLYEVTGLSDILRGSTNARETLGAQQMKQQNASIRIQRLQDEFARFATEIMALKAEIISKHFEPQTIARQSNIEVTPDSEIAPMAIQLIKDYEATLWKINIRPETLAMIDYNQMKVDRTEFMNALAMFLQSAAPVIESSPATTPMLLGMLKWTMAGFRGSNEIEGMLDRAIDALQQELQQRAENPEPDPEQQKAEMEMQKLQAKHQMEMESLQAKFQIEQQKLQMEMQKIFAKLQAELQKEEGHNESNVQAAYEIAAIKIGEALAKSQVKINASS